MKTRTPQVAEMLTGIQGFDEISDGGLSRERTTLIMGGPGCGKTVFALQSLVNGAHRRKEAGIFVAFEESTRQIIGNAASFGWDLPALEKRQLFFLDARLSPEVETAGDFDLIGMLKLLEAKAEEIHAKRIVVDGIDVLLGLLDDPVAERREIYRLRDWLSRTGLTGIITQRAGVSEADQRYNFLQFMVDCVVALRHQVNGGAAFRNLRIIEYRGSGFSGDEFPISLTAGMDGYLSRTLERDNFLDVIERHLRLTSSFISRPTVFVGPTFPPGPRESRSEGRTKLFAAAS